MKTIFFGTLLIHTRTLIIYYNNTTGVHSYFNERLIIIIIHSMVASVLSISPVAGNLHGQLPLSLYPSSL